MGLSQEIKEAIKEAVRNTFGDNRDFSLVKREGSLIDGVYYEDESYEEEYADVEVLIGDVERTADEIYKGKEIHVHVFEGEYGGEIGERIKVVAYVPGTQGRKALVTMWCPDR
jgi:hypothetical protein